MDVSRLLDLVFEDSLMIHHSCDRCKRMIDPDDQLRYIVKIEACAAMEPVEMDEPDDDRDHLLEVQEILERLDDEATDAISDDVYQKRRYDLCAKCYQQFRRNPLGREVPAQLGFSSN